MRFSRTRFLFRSALSWTACLAVLTLCIAWGNALLTYHGSSATPAVVRHAYRTTVVVPAFPNEVISKRTANSITREATDVSGRHVYTTTFYSNPEFAQGDDGQWYEIAYATTPESSLAYLGRLFHDVFGAIAQATSVVFYPDSGKPGTTSVDGEIDYTGGATYATAHDATTGTALDGSGTGNLVAANTSSSGLYNVKRALINFDTSSLPDNVSITSAVLSLYVSAVANVDTDSASIVANTGASSTNYTTADFNKFGTAKLATDIAIGSLNLSAYNNFTLNASGIAAITPTGITKFGMRTAKDISNTQPSAGNFWEVNSADAASNKPYLTVTYTNVTISGTVYDTDGTSTLNVATAMKLAVNGGTSYTATSSAVNGSFSFSSVAINVGDIVTIWLNTDAGTTKGTLVFRYGSSCGGYTDCTGLKVIKNRVSLQSFDGASITNANLAACDNDTGAGCADTDIGFTSESSALSLTYATNQLYVPSGTTYAPGGTITAQKLFVAGTYSGGSETATLSAAGTNTSCTATDATPLCVTGTFTAGTTTVVLSGTGVVLPNVTFNNVTISGSVTSGTNTASVGGRLRVNSGGTFTPAAGTITLSATNAAISNAGTLTFSGLTLASSVTASASTNFSIGGALTVGTSAVLTPSTGTITFNNGSSIANSGTLTFKNIAVAAGAAVTTSSNFSVATRLALVSGSTFTASGGTVTLSTTGAAISNIGGTLTFSGLTLASSVTASASTNFSVGGALTLGSSANLSPSSGTVTMNAGSSIAVGTSGTLAFSSLTTVGAVSTANSFSVAGTFTVNAGSTFTPAAANIISGAGTLTGFGMVYVTRTAATADFASQYTITNKTLTNLSIVYNTAGQVISNNTYGNLTVSGAATNTTGFTLSGTLTITGAGSLTSSGGTLTANGGSAILSSGSFSVVNLSIPSGTVTVGGALTVTSSLSVNGIFIPSASTIISGGQLLGSGTVKVTKATGVNDFAKQYNLTTLTLGSLTVDYAGTAAQGVSNERYTNLTLTNTNIAQAMASISGTFNGGTANLPAAAPGADATKLGTGADGPLTVTGTTYTDSVRSGISTTSNSGQAVVSVTSATGFSAGDEVLVIQMIGTGVGNYETKTIQSTGTGTLTMTTNLAHTYINGTNSKAQVIRVPNYTTVTVQNGGTLTAHTWNGGGGSTGGVLIFRSSQGVTVQSGGIISVTSVGDGGGSSGGEHAGGAGGAGAPGGAGATGQSCVVPPITYGTDGSDAPGGNGSGKGVGGSWLYCRAGYGGAGGSGSSGDKNDGASGSGPGAGSAAFYANGGSNISDNAFATVVVGGGGAGGSSGTSGTGGGGGGGGGGGTGFMNGETGHDGEAGGQGGTAGQGGGGGSGGGIIMIYSNAITVSGTITANGADGAAGGVGSQGADGGIGGQGGTGGGGSGINSGAGGGGGGGGAGSSGGQGGFGGAGGGGGSILLSADTLSLGTARVTASGGSGGGGGAGGSRGSKPAGGPGSSGSSSDGSKGGDGLSGSDGAVGGNGIAGGNGKIRLEYTTLSGTVSPTQVSTGTFNSSSAGSIIMTGSAWSIAGTPKFSNLRIAGTPATQPTSSFSMISNGLLSVDSGVTFSPTAGTLTMTGSASFSGAGTLELFNMVASGSGTTVLGRNLVVKNNLTNNSGHTINLGSNTLTLQKSDGSFTNGGTITGTTDSTFEYAPSTTSGTTVTATTYPGHLKVNKAGNTFTVPGGTLVAANLDVTAGTLDLSANNPSVQVGNAVTIGGTLNASGTSTLTVGGNWTNNGTFTHNNGTVVLQPSSANTVVDGSVGTNFYNLTSSIAGKTLQFSAGKTFGVAGTLTLAGASGTPLYLVSSTPGSSWTLNLSGSGTASYVYVQDGACSPGSNTISLGETGDTLGNTGVCWVRLNRGGGGTGGENIYGGGSSSGGGTAGGGGPGEGGEGGGTPAGGGTPGGDTTPAP